MDRRDDSHDGDAALLLSLVLVCIIAVHILLKLIILGIRIFEIWINFLR